VDAVQETSSSSSGGRARVALLFAFFFLVIAAFWIQKPIRTSRFLAAVGPEALPLVKLGTALLIFPVVMIYSSLAARYRRQSMVYLCTGFFALCSIGFWLAFREEGPAWTHYVYFFYVDIFNSVMVALFWSVANDVSSPEAARRDYGVIGAGGIVGGAVGSGFTGWTVERLGTANLLLVCVVVLLAIAAVAFLLSRTAERPAESAAKPDASLRDAVAGARLTWQSNYLTCIALVVVFYEIVSNVVDYQFNTFVAQRYVDEGAIAAFLGRFNTASITASAAIQFVLTTWILRRWGPSVGLLLLPLALAVGSGSLLVVPVFGVIAATFFSDATLGYSLNQASKEVLYTTTDEATKYQAKAFIDMFLMRLAKGVSSLLILAWAAWLAPQGVAQLAVLSLAVIVPWLLVARAAGRQFTQQTGAEPEESVRPPQGARLRWNP
jgi:ATP:ADP antiporter, AAA family